MTDPDPKPGDGREVVARPGDLRKEMSEEDERARALVAVLRDQAERVEAARAAEERTRKRTRIRRGVLTVVWAAMAYVWLASPSWLAVKPPPVPTVADEARSLRVDMFLQSQKILAYQKQHGRLPYVLAEAGPVFPGMRYHRKDSRFYELFGTSARVRLEYDSETSPLAFVGPAAGVLEGKSPRIRR